MRLRLPGGRRWLLRLRLRRHGRARSVPGRVLRRLSGRLRDERLRMSKLQVQAGDRSGSSRILETDRLDVGQVEDDDRPGSVPHHEGFHLQGGDRILPRRAGEPSVHFCLIPPDHTSAYAS